MDGILNINKAVGMTSHDVVARARKILKQKRIGHTGTLDPLASGVLPLCIGQATRVAEYLSESGKAYQAEITFGVTTDTYDAEGTVLSAKDTSALSHEQIEEMLPAFLGHQMQQPPRYSAIKIQGQPAYKLARAGEEVSLALRSIEITQLHVLAWNSPRLSLAIECSKGTYIRSLANDLGNISGYGAHLSALIRTRSGPFSLKDSISLEQLAESVEQEEVAKYLFPADSALQNYPAFHLDAGTAQSVLHGNPFFHQSSVEQNAKGLARIYAPDGHFLAIASWDTEHQRWQPRKVLA
ncbi:MAG: tRNA pseudouridine(55) synthase TruB [Ktedonobacteraceae bacterium]|nr:tRNA pseudouridine(55) synthase TruB [Ktedonobacteraceae bacterium]